MKGKLLSLDLDDPKPLSVGLIRLSTQIPPYQFFFELNKINPFQFQRSDDLIVPFAEENYNFLCMQGYDEVEQTNYQMIANKSFRKEIKTPGSLFESYEHSHVLLEKQLAVDYLLLIKREIADFSLILLPENRVFPIQTIEIRPEESVYQYIEENE